MVTIAAAIIAAIEANWAIGGDPPEFLNSEINLYPSTANVESIYVMGYTLKTAIDPKTLKRANKTHYIQLLINTSDQTNRESRLNDLVEEVERIINTTGNVTGYSSVKVTDIDRTVTLKEQHVYRALMTVRLLETMVDSATASGYATSDYHIAGDLIIDGLLSIGSLVFLAGGSTVTTILDEDNMATDSATALATQQSIKAYADVIQADVDGFHDELKDLTQVEIQQLENIAATTISEAQWGYLGALDQALTQASSPTFVGLTLSDELDMTGAVSIDLNPSGTGSQNIIDLTPSAALVAGSSWKGLHIVPTALDPATGATSYVYGIEIENRFVESVDKNAYIHGVVVRSAPGDTGYSFVDYVTEKTQNKVHRTLYSSFGGVLSATATYDGVYIGWDGLTRDGGAPVLRGFNARLPADYTDFGTCYAGYFSGDGRSVTICDTTYALNVSGVVRVVGDVTVDNLITAGNVDGVDVSTFKTAYDAHVAASDLHVAHSGVSIIAGTGLSGGGTIAASRTINCDITQYTDGLARTACLEDDVYGVGWDADVTHAPTQNAVYDKINAMDTLIAANTTVVEVEAVITAELVNGQSIDLAIDALINTHNAADNHIAHSGVTIIAGTGLSGGGTIAATRTINCDITQYTDALAKAACVSDVAYAGTWDGVTDVAPSKNAVYDQIETLSGEFSLAFKTITGITNDVVADAVADTLTLASANNLLTIVGVTATDTITWTIVEGNFVLDGNTVQIDGINSDGGAFAFNTTGAVAFNQNLTVSGGTIKTLADNGGIYVGIGDDLRIYHSGTHSYITNSTGTLYLDNTGDNMSSNTVNWYFDLTASFVIRDRDDGDAEVFKLDTSARTLAIGNAADPVVTTMYGDLTVSGTGLSTIAGELKIGSTSEHEILFLHRAANTIGNAGYVLFQLNDDLNATRTYAQIGGVIADPSNASIDGKLAFLVKYNNSITNRMELDQLGNLQIDGDLTVSGDDIKNSNGSIMISFSVGDVYIDGLADIAADVDPYGVHKLYDMGIAALAWDECYADNWNNVSSWKTLIDPFAVLRGFRPRDDDPYEIDHSGIDDWLRSRIKAKAKNEKGFLKWEGGYVLKPEKAKTKARKVYVERLGRKVPVGNYLDGYSDEDFEHEDAYSINKTQIVMIQAIKKIDEKLGSIESRLTALEAGS